MKRHLAPSLFALSLCALLGGARAAAAQDADAIVPAPIDSVVVPVRLEPAVAPLAVEDRRAVSDLAPVIRPSISVISRAAEYPMAVPAPDVAAFQGRDWKMPTSRTLMIGGAAVAIIGLVAVQGDAGAIMALAGGGVAVYGLYLHYNR